jgi:hypothetical protein
MRSRAVIVVAALAIALSACTSDGDDEAPVDTGSLTRAEYDAAVDLARHEVETQDAKVTSATVVLKANAGQDAESNTGHPCTGKQVLKVRLIGDFPHIVTSGGPPGGDPNGGTVTEVDIKAELDGTACLVGVSTNPQPTAEPGATVLQLG